MNDVIRRLVLVFALAAAASLSAGAASAAPTCQDINGRTTRCGTEGAMPVGWTAPPDTLANQDAAESTAPTAQSLLGLVCALGIFFALLALMPEFDGWRAGDWGAQENGDGDE